MALINAAVGVQRAKGQRYWRDCASGCAITVHGGAVEKGKGNEKYSL